MIPLRFEKLSRHDRFAEFASIAVPFARAALRQADDACIVDGDTILPTQAHVLSRWDDGSIKWLMVHLLVDLPGNAGKVVRLDPTAGRQAEPVAPITIEAASRMRLTNGPLDVTLGGSGEGLFQQVALRDRFLLHASQWDGPRVESGGRSWRAMVGAAGWRILYQGPVYACLETRGRHRDDQGDEELLDFTCRVHIYAGKPWVRLNYQLVNREARAEVSVEEISLNLQPQGVDPASVRTALGHSNYRTTITQSDVGGALSHLIDADLLIYEANEQVAETHYGTLWADWCGPNGGVCVTQHQAQQNFPKAMRVSGVGLNAEILPRGQAPLVLARGMAKTHCLLLHMHEPDAPLEELDARSLQFQMPDRPTLPAEVYRASGLFPGIWPDRAIGRVERHLIDLADHRTRAYGMLHWGDAPDRGYTEQGRGGDDLVWTNNEYDLPHAAMLMYARTGERRMLDYLLVAAEHWMNVDVCHDSDDPLRHRGQIEHSAHHVAGRCSPCHEWVEGLLDYYHQTGDPFALETALGIGENVLRHLGRPELREPGASATRVTGWALRTLVALYEHTHDEKWIAPAANIARQFQDWMDRFGGWLAPYTSHTMARVPFMMAIAASSLMRYWRVTKDPAVADLIVAGVRDIVDNCLMPDGRFFYKELPSLQKRHSGYYVLEALAYAYEISGDRRFIEVGLVTFEEAMSEVDSKPWSGRKYRSGTAVIAPSGPGPKVFASQSMPIFSYYAAAVKAGVLV